MKIYSVYRIEGLNLDKLLNSLKRKGITLYSAKKEGKSLTVKVNYKDGKKLFAYSTEMCYNIVKLKDCGLFYPLLFLRKNIGVFIGAVIFFVLTVISNGYLFDYSFSGNGAIYSREVKEFLTQKGITAFTKFSDIELKKLSADILKSNANLSFVECRKKGNYLSIELVLLEGQKNRLSGKEKEIFSTYSGIVESITVYRGRALVNVGDRVKVGDKLVEGVMTVKDSSVEVNVIASIVIGVDGEKLYLSKEDNEAEAMAFALADDADGEIISLKKTFDGENYSYVITVRSYKTITVG